MYVDLLLISKDSKALFNFLELVVDKKNNSVQLEQETTPSRGLETIGKCGKVNGRNERGKTDID